MSCPAIRCFHENCKSFSKSQLTGPNGGEVNLFTVKTLPLPGSGSIRKSEVLLEIILGYHPPCPGVFPEGSLLKLPTVRLSKFSLYNTCAVTKLVIKIAVAV